LAYPDKTDCINPTLDPGIDRSGLYDTESQKGVHALAASGVGDWSLVYTNVAKKPDTIVIDNWGTILK
jgi:hypothetical protein